MTRQEKFAHALLKPINTSAVVILGIYTFMWGFWVANPFWEVFTQAELYGVLATVAPEVFWGCLAMVVGTTTTYGACKKKYRELVIGSTAAAWHWLMISVFYFLGDPLNTGGITALMLFVYGAFVYLNIKVNFGDDKKSRDLLDP